MAEPLYPLRFTNVYLDDQQLRITWSDGTVREFKVGCLCNNCRMARTHNRNLDATVESHIKYLKSQLAASLERSKILLISLLDHNQKIEFEACGSFLLQSQDGHIYRIRTGYSGNVQNTNTGKYYCCYLKDQVPIYDHMIGQLLALKYHEDLFLATAY